MKGGSPDRKPPEPHQCRDSILAPGLRPANQDFRFRVLADFDCTPKQSASAQQDLAARPFRPEALPTKANDSPVPYPANFLERRNT